MLLARTRISDVTDPGPSILTRRRRFGGLGQLMVDASGWRRVAAASTRWHDAHHPCGPCRARKRHGLWLWRFRAAISCSRRVRAAAPAWRLSCDGPCARLPRRIGMVQSLARWLLRMQRDRHGAMPQSWWRGRAEKRRGPEDDAFRLIAHGRPGENDMLTCAGYVCNVLILVRITSQDLVLHSSACG